MIRKAREEREEEEYINKASPQRPGVPVSLLRLEMKLRVKPPRKFPYNFRELTVMNTRRASVMIGAIGYARSHPRNSEHVCKRWNKDMLKVKGFNSVYSYEIPLRPYIYQREPAINNKALAFEEVRALPLPQLTSLIKHNIIANQRRLLAKFALKKKRQEMDGRYRYDRKFKQLDNAEICYKPQKSSWSSLSWDKDKLQRDITTLMIKMADIKRNKHDLSLVAIKIWMKWAQQAVRFYEQVMHLRQQDLYAYELVFVWLKPYLLKAVPPLDFGVPRTGRGPTPSSRGSHSSQGSPHGLSLPGTPSRATPSLSNRNKDPKATPRNPSVRAENFTEQMRQQPTASRFKGKSTPSHIQEQNSPIKPKSKFRTIPDGLPVPESGSGSVPKPEPVVPPIERPRSSLGKPSSAPKLMPQGTFRHLEKSIAPASPPRGEATSRLSSRRLRKSSLEFEPSPLPTPQQNLQLPPHNADLLPLVNANPISPRNLSSPQAVQRNDTISMPVSPQTTEASKTVQCPSPRCKPRTSVPSKRPRTNTQSSILTVPLAISHNLLPPEKSRATLLLMPMKTEQGPSKIAPKCKEVGLYRERIYGRRLSQQQQSPYLQSCNLYKICNVHHLRKLFVYKVARVFGVSNFPRRTRQTPLHKRRAGSYMSDL